MISFYMDVALSVDHAELLIQVHENYIRTKLTSTHMLKNGQPFREICLSPLGVGRGERVTVMWMGGCVGGK